jgi:uncharacterized protein YydD (DUF2326 family)
MLWDSIFRGHFVAVNRPSQLLNKVKTAKRPSVKAHHREESYSWKAWSTCKKTHNTSQLDDWQQVMFFFSIYTITIHKRRYEPWAFASIRSSYALFFIRPSSCKTQVQCPWHNSRMQPTLCNNRSLLSTQSPLYIIIKSHYKINKFKRLSCYITNEVGNLKILA